MATEAELAELTEQHRQLEADIEEEMSRPMADSLKISQLKREKLRIKEEIVRLKSAHEAVA